MASNQYTPVSGITVVPVAEIPANRFVSWTEAIAGAGVPCMGITEYKVEAGFQGHVITHGTALVEAGAAIDGTVTGLKSDANGRAVPVAAGTDVIAGRLRRGARATAVGELIEVFPIQS